MSRKYRGNRYARPAGVMGSSTSYARPSGDIRESLWHTFDVAPRFHRDSRRFQSQLWSTFDVAPLAETLEDRTLLSSVSVNSLTSNDTTPTVTGSYVDDAGGGGSPSIQITVNGNMYAATLNPGGVGSSIGTWSANVTNVLPENVYDVAAQVTDSNSATSNDATSNELTIDTTAPTAAVNIVDASLSDSDNSSVVNITLSEASTNFAIGDLAAVNGTLSGFGGAGTNYTVTFTADDGVSGTGSVTVTAGSYTDAAGNLGGSGTDNVTIDTLNPTAAVNIVDASLSDSDNSSVVNITLSEASTNFAIGDLVAVNGTLSGFGGAGTNYTVTLTADDGVSGTGSVTVTAGSYTDAAGNLGGSGTDNVTIDTLNPTATVSVDDSSLIIGDTATVTIVFSEAINPATFTTGDMTSPNGTLSGLTTGNNITFTATLTPAASTEAATNVVTLTTAGVTDVAGNAGTGTPTSGNYAVDTIRPTVASIVRTVGVDNPTVAATVTYTVTFSENVTGVGTGDFTTSGSAPGTSVTGVSGSGSTRTVTVNTGTGEGTINLDLAGGATITDVPGNSMTNFTPAGADEDYAIGATSAILSGGTLTVSDFRTATNETLTISLTGGLIRVASNGNLGGSGFASRTDAMTLNFAGVTALVVNGSGGTYSVTLNTSTHSFNSLNLTAETIAQSSQVIVTGTTSLTAGSGSITLANAANDFGGAVTVVSGGTTSITDTNALTLADSNTTGTTTLQAGTNLTLNNLSAASQTVSLTATAGSILDGNGGASNVTANSVTAVAATGIDLDTTISTLTSATTSGTGAIDISNTGALSATTVSSNDGSVTLNATSGDLTVATSVAAGGSNNATLMTTTGGNVVLTGSTTATGDQVTVTSAGNIDGSGLITATTVDLNSATSIGASNAINTAATSISADSTGSGNIDIDNSNAAAVTYTSLTTGTGMITVDNTGGGTATFTSVTTTSGNIDLENTGADLTATAVTAGSGSGSGNGDVNLRTTTSGDVLVGDVRAIADSLTINSAGAIEESTVDGGIDLDGEDLNLTAATGIGAVNQLEIDAFATSTHGLTASVTGTGAISVSDDSGGLRVLSATTNDGSIEIKATNGNMTVESATAGGSNNLTLVTENGTSDITIQDLDATGNQVKLTATGAIIDGGDTVIDITATEVVLRAATGVGSGNALETDINGGTLAAINTTSGSIQIDDTGANGGKLTIGTVDGLAGVTNQTPDGGTPATVGFISISNASPIDVVDNITANGDITLTTGDTDATHVDNLFIDDVTTGGGDLLIRSLGGSITLNVGDDAVIEGDLTAASIITINLDQPGSVSAAETNLLMGGGTLDIRLDEAATVAADAVLTATGGTFINGGSEDDLFIFQAQSTTSFTVNGNPPVFGGAGVPPGDTLRLDFTNVAGPPVLTTGISGAGIFLFLPPDNEQPVQFSSIETVDKINGTVNYHLVIDPTLAGSYGNQTADPNDTPDNITVRLNADETSSGGPAAGTDLIVERTADAGDTFPAHPGDFTDIVFRGTLTDILSLTIRGTDDNETLTIDETNGLPDFQNTGGFNAVAPVTRGVPDTLRQVWFDGSFNDTQLNLDNANASSFLTTTRGTSNLLASPISYANNTAANAASSGLTGTSNFGAMWLGQITIGDVGSGDPLEAGDITFGTRSDDGSVLWIDLNRNGQFDAANNEQIVDNSGIHGAQDRVGTVNLAAGTYNIGIAWYGRASSNSIEARFAQGTVAQAAFNTMTLINPGNGAQAGLWRSAPLENSHLVNVVDANNRAEFVFLGGGGTDAVNYVFNSGTSGNTSSLTYAVGDGQGGGDNQAGGNAEGAIRTTNDNGGSMLFYFTGLEPITVSGTAGGTFTLLGDDDPNQIDITDSPVAGFSRFTVSSPATTQNNGVSTYETLDLQANSFTAIEVFGMLGADSIDLIALDADQGMTMAMIRLDGDDTTNADNSNDTIRVRSYPVGNMSSLFGGAGDDTFNIFDAGNTVDNILGRMLINGETGTDTLNVNDSGSTTGGANGAGGETVNVSITTGVPSIDGIFGLGAAAFVMGTDILISDSLGTTQGSVEVLTVSTSADNDNINVNLMGNTTTDLTTITVNGSGGSDLFNIQSDTPATNASAGAADTFLNGNAGADQFFFESGQFVVNGRIDGGSGNDVLDYSAYGSGRTIQLVGVGSTDGFQGNDTSTSSSIAPPSGNGFNNIDVLIGTSMDDTLIGADLRNHWDIGGAIAGFDDAHFGLTGVARTDGGLSLVDSLIDTGVLVADEGDLSLTGNASAIGRPTGADPIAPNAAGEQDLAYTSFQFLVGALTQDDRFDLREDASVTQTINGRGGNDTIDYRDWTAGAGNLVIDLNTGTAPSINGGAAGGLVASGASPDDNSIENAFGGDGNDMIAGDNDNNILGDGLGSDTLWGDSGRETFDPTGITSGDDTFRLEPRNNETDVVYDIAGNDTVDFRFATAGVVYDADIVGIQDVFNLGNNANVNLRLHQTLVAGFIPQPVTGNTPYENVVGSQFDDIIDIDPLSISGNFPTNIPVNRFVDGNSPVAPATPGDTLNFDAKGQVVIDTGLSLTSQGVGTVGYASIETLTSFDDAPRFIDNGDDAFTLTPLDLANPARVIWTERADDGFGGSYVYSFADNTGGLSPHTATWTANGVSVAQYRVSITWPENITPNDPSDVPVQVFDGDTLLASLTINQQLRPSDLLDEGVLWHDLGIFTFQSHTARVVMSNETDRSVHADAIRLEQISPGPELRVELQDTGAYLIDAVDIVNVTTTLEVPTTRTFRITNEGTTDLTINDIELEQGGGTNWVLTPAVVTSFTLTPGESSFVTVTLLATTANGQADFPAELRIFSNDVDENVSQHLGQGVNPNPDGDPLNDVNPFTVPLNGVVSTADIIDDLDLRFDLIGNWGGPDSTEDPFGTGHRITANDGSGDRAIFRFDDLPDGRYRISTTWDSGGTLQLTTARYRVLDFSTVLNTVDVNQKIEPVGINDSGSIFQDLGGPYDITGGTIIVELLDTNVNGSTGTVVIADAVRIERLFDMVADATLLVSDDSFVTSSTEVADDTGVVSFGTVFPGAQVQKTFRVRNDGALPLTVREPISLPDAYTLISFNGVPPTNATEVELTNNGDFVDFVVQLNAATVGTISGELSFFTGQLAGGLEADPDENPVNVTLTATIQNTVIIDDQDAAGFTLAGTGFQTFIGYQGYHNEVHVVAGNGTGTNTATWTFTVDPGSTYRLGTSYTPFGNRATNAPYTIAGVTGGSTVVPINQQLTPNDRVVNGSAFEDLGVFIASGNTITVTLSDAGNGQTIADAVRLEALFGPEIEVSDDATGTNLQSAASSVDVGDVAQGAANLQRTFTITNDGQRALAVAAISLPSHYQFVGAVPTSVAAAVGGVPGSASFTVELTTADAGTYGGTVSIINDDADETPFSFNITGTVIGALGVDAFIIDSSDGPTAFSTVGSYSVFTGFGRNNSFEAAFAGDGSSVATWSFTGLTPGVYNVAATWTDYINRADDAPYTITDSTGSTTIDINQFKAPDDFTANGSTWERLPGSFVVDGTGTLTVTLSNLSSAGYVDADAIRIDRIGALPEIVMLDLGPDQAFGGGNDSNLPDGGTYDFGATTPGTAVVQTFRIANPGTAALTIGTLTLPAGFTTTYSPQTIAANGGFLDFTITYAGLVDATGTFSFLTNDDDESPFNFTVTGAATPAVFTIDNTAVAGFAATGAFVEFSGQGVQNSVHYKTATPVGAGDTATWTFNAASVGTSPTVGGTYRVSATWSPNANRATDAPFTISGINGGPLTIDVNQKLAPSSFFEDGVEWFDLEVVHVSAGGEIVVTLGDSANGDVIADSIRIEALTPVVPEIVVHDSGQVVVDGGTVDFGTTTAGATLSKTFTLVNSGQSNLIVQAPALPAGFTTTFTGATITPGNTTDVVINVTTTIEAVFTGTLSFASNDSNESPFNVSLSAAVAPPAALIIDNDDAGFTPSAQFALWSGQGFQNDVREDNTPGTGTSTSTWTFTSVPAGQYRVSTTWSPFNNRATDAPYTISGFDGGPVTFDINQQVSPGDFQVDGASWEEFGFFTLSATGTITVSLSDDANGNVIADAVRLDPVVGSEITVLNGTTLIIDGGTLEFGSIVQGTTTAGAITRTITVRNDGPDNLVLQPIPALTGFTISNTNFTTDQIVASGATASFDITIDTSAVAALNATLEFGNNDIDEGPFNITLTGNITTNAVQILDNGDAGYTPSSDEVTFTGQGFQGDVGEDSSQGTAATPATWAFSNLVSGGVYRVSATWTEFSNRATDAPYTISGLVTGVGGGAGGMVTVDVNQRVAPNDRVDQGTSFEDLGVFTLTGTTLTVSLSDDADGNVIADAIRIERITGPEIQVDLAGTVLVSGTSTVDFGTHIVGVTETRTFTVTNLGATALTVGAVPDGAGFTVTSNLPGAAIAPLGNATFTITMNTAAINTFNETLSFTNDDADGDEAPFQFTVTGVVASASASVITDNGDSNYVQSGEFAYWTQQGFQNDVAEDNTPGSGASTATWTFLGLAAGTYRVSATWSAYFNRATNAPYSINGGGAITVNQQLSPSDVSFTSVVDSGVAFADLDGAFVFAGGTLTVTLSDSADGNVIADAIRVQRISALQVAGGEAAAGSHARNLTSDDVADIVDQAIVIWSATGLSAAEANALSTVTFDVRDLAAGDLGAASNGTIYLDINGAGYGWFVDHTPMLNEEFRITDATLTAIENGPAAGEIDLLTVVLHELGHLIGRDHSSNDNPGDLMSETLGVGIRRLPQRSVANTSLPALYPTSVEPPSDSLNSLLQTPLDGSRTPAELYADRQDEDLIDPQIQTAAAPPSAHENNGIDEIFTLLTDGDGVVTQIPFDEL